MYCGLRTIKKNGRRCDRQRYVCVNCGKCFHAKQQSQRLAQTIWRSYTFKRQKLSDLATDYGRSINWIKKQIKIVEAKPNNIKVKPIIPEPTVIVVDSTFFKRIFGIMVARSPHLKQNIYRKEIVSETINEYLLARIAIEQQGWTITGVVLDGRRGAKAVFADLPVQMCQFHQKQIITRYLTQNPVLPASIELKKIVQFLCQTNLITFSKQLEIWHQKWGIFIKQKTNDTVNPKRWHYTHGRTRSAYRSLMTNLPYLFTYQKYPKLDIPNTTNSLDGYFSHLKDLVGVHRGLNRTTKRKMIKEILAKND